MEKPFVIAEIGCTHVGNIDRAKFLIDLAVESGADCVKLQKRNPKESVPKKWWDKPHPNQRFAYGKTYLEHRENLEFDKDQMKDLKDYCETKDIIFSTSVWDLTSAKEMIDINPQFLKIPSACNHDSDLINTLLYEYEGGVHISTGMSTKGELDQLLFTLSDDQFRDRIVVYHCTSAYPCPFDKLFIDDIPYLCQKIKNVGFSNHGKGIAVDIAALALGATYFERHFIDDRMFPHTDAAASLEPQGMSKLVRDLNNVALSLNRKPDQLDPLEQEQRDKLRNG